MGGVNVKLVCHLEPGRAFCDEALALYLRCFEPLRRRAMQRHVMFTDEFQHLMMDAAVEKHAAFLPDGPMVGLAVITNRLVAWPLISPEFVEAQYPAEFAAHRAWYVGFVAVDRPGRPAHTFPRLLEAMSDGRRENSVFFMDFCKVNEDRGIVESSLKALQWFDGRAVLELVDSQRWWAASFPGGSL